MSPQNLSFLFLSVVLMIVAAPITFVAVKFLHHHQPAVQLQQIRVTLIHRDEFLNSSSPQLNYTAWINGRLQRDTERVAGLTQLLNFSSVSPGREFSFGTPVMPANNLSFASSGEFLVPLEIGNPPVTQHLIIDTRSDLTWVQCWPCINCNQQKGPLYTPFKSDTSSITNCSSDKCSLLGKRRACCHQHPYKACTYEYKYGDGSFSKGELITESITIGGVRYNDLAVECGSNNQGSTLDMIARVMGLGDSPLAYVNQLGDMHRGGFSYCLSTNSITPTCWLEIGLGSVPRDLVWVPFQKKPISGFPFYHISLTGVGVENERLPVPEYVFQLKEKNKELGGVIFYSGTLITRFPREVYKVLRGAYVAKTASIPKTPPYAIFDTCYDLTGVNVALIPSVSFFFPTESLLLGQGGILIRVGDETQRYCLAFAPHDHNVTIIGNVQLQGIQVSYDLHNRRVAFGPRNC